MLLNSFLSVILDGGGVYGNVFYWSSAIALCGSAVLIFIHFWRKGRLDMDEEAAKQMLHDEGDQYE